MGRSKKTSTTKRETTRSPWLTQGSQQAVGMARDIAGREYSGYGGQRIADLSGNERMGLSAAQNEYGRYDQDFQSARESLGSIKSITDEGALEGYMNPYMEQVLKPQVRRRNRAFDESRSELRRTAGMRGAFGGRQQVMEGQLDQQHQEGMDDMYGSAYGQAFDRATGLFGQEQDRKIQQAGAFSQLAQGEAGVNRNAIRDLMATGITERTRDQADLDFKYLEHIEERDWDVQNLDTLVKTLQSVPHDVTETGTTTETSSDSPLKTIAGAGAIIGGAILTGGASLAGGSSMWGAIGDGVMAMAGATGET
jgi:hypothetical protein